MDKNSVQRAMSQYAADNMPTDPDLWPAIAASIAGASATSVQPTRSLHRARLLRLRLPATRLGWTVLILAVLLTLSSVTYAASAIINRAYDQDPAFQQIKEYGQQLNKSQTINGRTVTLQRVYADADSIQIGYSIQGPDGDYLAPTAIRLIDEQGEAFHPLLGVQSVETKGPSGYALQFDNTALGNNIVGHHLYLSLSLVQSKPEGTPVPMVAPVRPSADKNQQDQAQPMDDVAGPFRFEFTVTK